MSDILGKRCEVLERYLLELRRELDFKLVILFRSLTHGDRKGSSGINLLIISDDLFDDLSDDPGENFIKLKWPGIELYGFGVKRFLRELKKPNLIIRDALEYDKRFVADEEFVKIVKDTSEKVKRRFG